MADMRTINGLGELQASLGEELGLSPWHDVTQARVAAFAEVTGDDYWLHLDPDRAAQTPMGGTIAHGLYTLALEPRFRYDMVTFAGLGTTSVNYGYNRVRFPAPLPVGSRVRMRSVLRNVDAVGDDVQITLLQTFEREGGDRPVCVAEALFRHLADR
jgi:acyl dehydratase